MLPEALQASLSILLLKFLLSAVPGSHSKLAANRLYNLRPLSHRGNKIRIQVKHVFWRKSKKANHEQSEGSQEPCHHAQRSVKPTPKHYHFHNTDAFLHLAGRKFPGFFLMCFSGLSRAPHPTPASLHLCTKWAKEEEWFGLFFFPRGKCLRLLGPKPTLGHIQ